MSKIIDIFGSVLLYFCRNILYDLVFTQKYRYLKLQFLSNPAYYLRICVRSYTDAECKLCYGNVVHFRMSSSYKLFKKRETSNIVHLLGFILITMTARPTERGDRCEFYCLNIKIYTNYE